MENLKTYQLTFYNIVITLIKLEATMSKTIIESFKTTGENP